MLLHWRVHRELLDWGAAELRKEPASDFELTWLRAAAALGFRARDRMWLATDGFLVRAVKRHPDNPRLRFQLASARVLGRLRLKAWVGAPARYSGRGGASERCRGGR